MITKRTKEQKNKRKKKMDDYKDLFQGKNGPNYKTLYDAIMHMNKSINCIGSDFNMDECDDVKDQIAVTITITYTLAILILALSKLMKHHIYIRCSKKFFFSFYKFNNY